MNCPKYISCGCNDSSFSKTSEAMWTYQSFANVASVKSCTFILMSRTIPPLQGVLCARPNADPSVPDVLSQEKYMSLWRIRWSLIYSSHNYHYLLPKGESRQTNTHGVERGIKPRPPWWKMSILSCTNSATSLMLIVFVFPHRFTDKLQVHLETALRQATRHQALSKMQSLATSQKTSWLLARSFQRTRAFGQCCWWSFRLPIRSDTENALFPIHAESLSRSPIGDVRRSFFMGYISKVASQFWDTRALLDGVDIWMGDHLDKMPCAVLLGKSGWRSGHQSRLPPLQQCWLWIEFQSISTWLRGFSLGTPVSSLLKIDS